MFSRRSLKYYVGLVILFGTSVFSFQIFTRSSALAEAQALYSRGDLVHALQRGLDHLERRPWDRDAAKTVALCLSRLDRASSAEPYYRRSGNWPILNLNEAQIRAFGLTRANLRDEAVVAYREILSRWIDDPLALQRLATVYLTMSRYPDALEIARRLAAVPGKEVLGYALIGTIAHQDGIPEDASAAYQRLFEIDPTLRELPIPRELFWSEFVGDLIESGRPADALKYLRTPLSETPDDPVLLDLDGQVAFQLGEFEAAEIAWKRASVANPKRPRPWLGLGQIALRRGEFEESIRLFDKSVTLDPSDPEARYQKSLAERRAGRIEAAERSRKQSEALRAKLKAPNRGMGSIPGKSP